MASRNISQSSKRPQVDWNCYTTRNWIQMSPDPPPTFIAHSTVLALP